MSSELETSSKLNLDFSKLKSDVLPVVVQHAITKDVLILAYVNAEALSHTQAHQVATFWSTSRQELWIKGSTSGDYLDMKEIRVNCEQNSLLFLVIPRKEGVCHTQDSSGKSRQTCFYRKLTQAETLEFL